ncbi:FAD dependent oxidoreductase [Lasiosphaeris hirsuta]|uniref:FAD dependent oxidoreductase n=1 Tax=Lasiosphaeris hirsuta TaxID=260670 RepID=A0AA40E962_9PEZI|nr:FAD dependent oxidoreductase [Lasiosphaeris hirsuta]
MSNTVILGVGIIGVSAAYYLSDHQPPFSIHLVEPALELFSSASGYAGGFLAKDWFTSAAADLGALSYELHRKLAADHAGRETWGYTATTSVNYATASPRARGARGDDWLRTGTSRAEMAPGSSPGSVPPWLSRTEGDCVEGISPEGMTAQVDPLRLCRFLLNECLRRGVRLHHPAEVLSTSVDFRGELASVRIADTKTGTKTDLPCTRIVIAAGAWSGQAFKELFPHVKGRLPIGSLAGHSIIVRSPRWRGGNEEGCHAVYTTYDAEGFSPEVYARLGGEIYIAGLNSTDIPLPPLPGQVTLLPEAIAKLRTTARKLLGPSGSNADSDDGVEVVREGLCFRPVTPRGMPIISRIPDEDLGMATRSGAEGGVFLCSGHGPWGISLSLGTGLVVSEMAQGRDLSADISGLGLQMK